MRSTLRPISSSWHGEPEGRYEILELIGAGGMGRVYKARDPRLSRNVALKFIRDNEPHLVERFLQEAQAQARIEHPHVCKVHEAGEMNGEPYIAMQLIDGPSLKAAKRELTLEQKLLVMRKVAEGLHAAHRLGMIHRDIKPANVMLERKEDGSFHPYVMDFGLARDVGGDGHTMTEAAVGTPAYMAPEQITGDTRHFDRRTDVYALGATLYELLTGKPPFTGQTSLEIMMKVAHEEPRPVRALDPEVPKDLQTIVMKCLEKESHLRYESARAFAEDLERYQNGDPIRARPGTLGYVLLKKAKKHKAIVLLGGIALVSALVLVILWVHAEVVSKRREALAEQLGQRVTEVELFLRYAIALPAHDMASERAVIRERMGLIQDLIKDGGRSGEGPGRYALGRGHLALHDYAVAREHLEKALAAGYKRPEVFFSLGLALGGLYQDALDRAQRIEDKGVREAKRREVEQTYREPALRNLRASEGTQVESKTYIEGLVALYEERYGDAITKAEAAAKATPWLYEAKKLEGDARFAVGMLAKEGGREDARRALEGAVVAYKRAADMARSDGAVHEALAEAWIQLLEIDLQRGSDYHAAFEAALGACALALEANPASGNAFSKRGRAYFQVGFQELQRGADPRPTLERAIASSEEALRWSPDDAITLDSIGNSYHAIADYERKVDLDPKPSLEKAMASFEAAIKAQPTLAWAWNDAGYALLIRAEIEAERGIDPSKSVEESTARLKKATELDPAYLYPHANMAWVSNIGASYELASGRDPRPDARRALESSARAALIDPNWWPVSNNKGWSHLFIAQYEDATGGGPTTSLDQAEASFRAALVSNADVADTHYGLGMTHHARADYLIRTGGDPTRALDEALASLRRAVELDKSTQAIRIELSRVLMTAARRAAALKRDPAPLLDAARETLTSSSHVHARHAQTLAALAELHALCAELGRDQPRKRDEEIREGLERADKALENYAHMPQALAAKGALLLASARLQRGMRGADEACRAVDSFEDALARNPLLHGKLDAMRAEARGRCER